MPTLLITGASGGIATALRTLAADAGWTVVAATRDAARLADAGLPAECVVQADVSTPEGAAALFATLAERGLAPDRLAHLAGSTLIAPLARVKPEQFRAVMAANLDSAFYTLQAFVAALRTRESAGAAVLASSVVAQIGTPHHEAIAAAKGGVEALVRAAAASHAAFGIRINAVAPGLTETPMTAGITRNPAMREGAGRQYPLGGINRADDVAQAAWWLLGDGAARITGQVVAVDGGFTAIRPLVK
jgi:NAD(P)-dependent dehydrogenase (short-subunit alcohol dehydrogenase family)